MPSPPWAVLLPRAIVAVTGPDTLKFLQGLISADAMRVRPDSVLYSFLLSPQGKYLFDFFLHAIEGGVALDVAAEDAPALAAKLTQYKLRSKAAIAARDDLAVAALIGGTFPGSLADPRFPGLGHRAVLSRAGAEAALAAAGFAVLDAGAYDAHRRALGVPEGVDFQKDQSFLLECNGEELHGVDFRKGCYVGQELTARMKHRGTARKRILRVTGAGLARGAPVLDGTREIGTVLGASGPLGLASVRLDRWREAKGRPLTCQGSSVEVALPAYPLILPPDEDPS